MATLKEAVAMVLPLTPDEALVVDVARGLDAGSRQIVQRERRLLLVRWVYFLFIFQA